VITAAAKNRLPAIYPYRYYVADGGLISYGAEPSNSSGAPPAMSIAS
jgi:putative tryptophan/tyrosine transport system substrate-binding protein